MVIALLVLMYSVLNVSRMQLIYGNSCRVSKVYLRVCIYQKDGFCTNEAIAIGTDGECSDYVVSLQHPHCRIYEPLDSSSRLLFSLVSNKFYSL